MSDILFRCWATGLLACVLCLTGCPGEPPADDDDTAVGDDDDTSVGDDDDSAVGDDDDSAVGDDDDTSVGDDDDSAVGDDDDSSVGDDDDSAVGDDDDSAAPIPACADGSDNDSDGWVDLDDPGCDDSADDSEDHVGSTLECDDGQDNDGDGDVDGLDTACDDATDDLEAELRVGDVAWVDTNNDNSWSCPTETLTITATLYNESSESFVSSVGAVLSVDPAAFLLTPSYVWLNSLPAGASAALSFNVTCLAAYPAGTEVTFTIDPSTPNCATVPSTCPDPNPYILSITLD